MQPVADTVALLRSARAHRRLLNWTALLLALAWILLLFSTLDFAVDDFKQYWQAGRSLGLTGDPYVATLDSTQRYFYPPPFAAVLRPLSALKFELAQRVWFVLNVSLLAIFVWQCLSISGSALAKRYWGVVALGFVLAPPTRLTLQLGQISLLLAVLLAATWSLARRRPLLAGSALAAASMIKIFPALLTLLLLFHRRWKLLLGFVGGCLALVLLALIPFGVQPYVSFVSTSLASGDYPLTAEHNISVVAFWQRLLTTSVYAVPVADLPSLATALTTISTLAVAGVLWQIHRRGCNLHIIVYCAWLCGMLLLSPSNGYYSLVLLLLPLLAMIKLLETKSSRSIRSWLVIATALVCIPPGWAGGLPSLNQAVHTGWGLLALTPSLYGLIIYVVLLAIFIRERRSSEQPS